MSSSSELKRVLWRDGDVVSEGHFYALEGWTEQLVEIVNQQSGVYGLVRNPALQPTYNDLNNVALEQREPTQYRLTLEQFQAITPQGHLIRVDERRSMDFQIRPAQKTSDGIYTLYIMPAETRSDGSSTSDSDVVTGVVMYSPVYECAISNDRDTGVPLCRFKVAAGEVSVDPSFIPFGLYIDSSVPGLGAHEEFQRKFVLLKSLVEKYITSLKPTPELEVIWSSTASLVRVCGFFDPIFESTHTPTGQFFRSVRQFLNSLATDLQLVSIGWTQESLRKRIAETLEALRRPLYDSSLPVFDLAEAFRQSTKCLETVASLLAFFPAGPIAEKTLPIGRVDFTKEIAGNKFIIHLESEAQFAKGKSQLTIYLREFSKADPLGAILRVGLGAAIFAQLLDLKNLLKKIPGESFSYSIECPPEIITKDRATQLILYLPPPLGEGILDVRKHITIVVRD